MFCQITSNREMFQPTITAALITYLSTILLPTCSSEAAAASLIPTHAARSSSSNYSCPLYETIRKPSVAEGVFKPSDLEGVWYLAATTELTTKFCLCNVMTYTVYTSCYRYTDTCFQVNNIKCFCFQLASPRWRNTNSFDWCCNNRLSNKHQLDLMTLNVLDLLTACY